jgi:hypothetical protein
MQPAIAAIMTFATLGANGLHIHQLSPQTPAQMRGGCARRDGGRKRRV